MNDIEKAIRYLENINQDCESCNYNNDSHNTDGSECQVSHNVNLAIEALKEKQERDNMRCRKCKHFKLATDYVGDCERENILYFNVTLEDYCSYFERIEI